MDTTPRHSSISFLRISFSFVLLLILLTSCTAPLQPRSQQARQGLLDLKNWDFATKGTIPLKGEWRFYYGQLLAPKQLQEPEHRLAPSFIHLTNLASDTAFAQSGLATLQLTLKAPQASPLMALKITSMPAAYRLWIDGHLLMEQGVVGHDKITERPAFGRKTVVFQPQSTEIRLTLQISHQHHIGNIIPQPNLLLGTYNQIIPSTAGEQRLAAILLCVSLFMVGYHLFLFLFHRQDRSTLYFALFCLLWLANGFISYISAWLLSFNDDFGLVWLMYRCDLLSYQFTIPLLALFLRAMFPHEIPRSMPKLALACAVLSAAYILSPQWLGLHPLESRGPHFYHAISTVFICWCVARLLRAWHRKRSGAGLILTGFVLMALVGINDMLYDLKVIDSSYLMPVGLLLFNIFQALALARRFTRAMITSEELSHEMQEKNIALSRMDQLKDEFLANTSHELRTPLAGIIGICESLLAGSAGPLAQQAQHNLQLVVGSSRRLTTLINDILDFTKLRNRDLPLQLKSVDTYAIAEIVIGLLTPLAEAKQLTLSNQISPNLPRVSADEDRLRQILHNLIGNAIKFSDQGHIIINGRILEDKLELSVSDQGIGIKPDSLETIFAPFEQVDSAATRAHQGTGLGLAITRNLVQLHGGELRVSSQPGQGSVFSFTLPLSDDDLTTTSQKSPMTTLSETLQDISLDSVLLPAAAMDQKSDPGTAAGDILVVDDEPVNLQVLVNQLHLAGYRVRVAASGAEALEQVAEAIPDLILLDIMMPNMTGYEVCQCVRQNHSAVQLPVIMLTARSRISDVVQGFQAGANDYVVKPFSREVLLARVKTQLQLTQAYHTLAENLRLKQELQQRQQTEWELRQTQRCLGQLLDSVDDMVITINENREISFYNQSTAQLLGVDDNALLGLGLEDVFKETWVEKLNALSDCSQLGKNDDGTACSLSGVEVVKADGHTQQVDVIATMLTLEDETLQTLILRVPQDIAPSPSPVTFNVIAAVNRHQQRLRGLENALNDLLPRLQSAAPEVVNEIRTLDQALADVEKKLQTSTGNDRRRMAVQVMQLSIDYWYEATDLDKVDLARESGIWKLYTDRNGYTRAQTLDKYLSEETFPRRPRWKSISNTAVYVLGACTTPSPLRERLEQALDRLRQQK